MFSYVYTYISFAKVATFAEDVIGMSTSGSLSLLLVLNAVGTPGRIVPAILADKWLGPVNTLILFVICSGVLIYCWAAVHSIAGIWAFVLFYGFFGAGVQGLFPPALGSLTPDLNKLGIRIGMVFSVISLGCLIGAPIAGALITADNGAYLHAQMFGGTIMVAGASLLVGGRLVRTGPHFFKKA